MVGCNRVNGFLKVAREINPVDVCQGIFEGM